MGALTKIRSRLPLLPTLAAAILVTGFVSAALYKADSRWSHQWLLGETLARDDLRAKQLAASVGQQMGTVIDLIDIVAKQLTDSFISDRARFGERVASTLTSLPPGAVSLIVILDRSGRVIYSSNGSDLGTDLGDRPHFRFHADGSADTLYIGAPVRGRLGEKRWVVPFTRAIRKNGRLEGVVMISLHPEFLSDTLTTLSMNPRDVVSLLRNDGTYIIRNHHLDEAYAERKVPIDRPYFDPKQSDDQTFRATSPLEHITLNYAWKRLDRWPLISVVALDENAELAAIETTNAAADRRSSIMAAAMIGFSMVVSGLLLWAERQQRRLSVSEGQIARDSERYQVLLRTASDGIHVVDEHGTLIEASDSFWRMLGYGAERPTRLNLADWDAVIPPDHLQSKINALILAPEIFATRHRRTDGSLFDVEVNCRGVVLDGRHYLYASARDITERKQSEQKIIHLTHLYKARSALDQAIVRMPNPAELYDLACRYAVEYGGMLMAFVCLHDDRTGLFKPIARHGIGTDYVDEIMLTSDSRVPEGQGPIATAYRTGRFVVVNSFPEDSRVAPWRQQAAKHGWQSSAAFPVTRGGRPRTVLSVYFSERNGFDDEMTHLLQEMAENIAFAIDNYDREQSRRDAEEKLRLAALVYEVSTEGIAVTDPNGVIITVNSAFAMLTGYSKEESIGQSMRILKSGRHNSAFYQEMREALDTTGQWKGEIWNRRKNGEIYLELLSISTVYNADGSPSRRVALFSDITEQKRSQEKIIWQQANFDFLTGLPNRRMFLNRLEQEIKTARRIKASFALIFIDLDRFKEVNDSYGHDTGDRLLQDAAQRLTACVRETDMVGRLGGDEFTVLLTGFEGLSGIERVAASILATVAAPYDLGTEQAYVSASMGITLFPDDGEASKDLLKNADQAMYEAKNSGRNRFKYFKPAMQDVALNRIRMENDLRNALPNGQFRVYFQPIIELATGQLQKAEALIRWQHPIRGLINPVEFIPIAEETGLIVGIGEWVFRQAALHAARWLETFGKTIQISVNVSPAQFQNDGSDPSAWRDHLNSHNLTGHSIIAEITEGMLMEASETINAKLLGFRDQGIQVSLDDFGTGYSSLSYLKKFDIDYLKIDQSFVRGLETESSDRALCEAIIVMAHKLGMKVIAEGVETQEQRDILFGAGCDYGQGFLFSRPIPAKEFEGLFAPEPWPTAKSL